MKYYLLTLLFFATSQLMAQNFVNLGTDPAGDDFNNYGMDLVSIDIASDMTQDSVWIRIKTDDPISDDWGFAILFDTNEVANDGKPWNVTNQAGNYDLGYEMKLDLMNNKFFPPTHIIIYDTTGKLFNQDISYDLPDQNTMIIKMKLSTIDPDGKFNLLVGGGAFDGIINDNMPNSSYFSYDAQASTTSIATIQSNDVKVYPNPTSDLLRLEELDAGSSIRLLDLTGKIQLETMSTTSNQTLDMSELPSGQYILQVENSNTRHTQSIYKL